MLARLAALLRAVLLLAALLDEAVVVFVWVASAGAGWVVRRVDRTAVFVCRPKDAARHAWGASGLCA